ncbi:MAG: beta-lactamase family protein, partial [Desulfobacterales bacterium]|nr:beta-lactamase family protein [Desulfobacterales bacterium]
MSGSSVLQPFIRCSRGESIMYVMASPESAGLCGRRLGRVQHWMRRYIDSGRLPGAITLVARRGRVVFCESLGLRNPDSDEPMTTDAIFRLHSMTTPVTCAAVMMLHEEGLFQLDDPLWEFIPDFKETPVYVSGEGEEIAAEPAREPITIHHLLTHTSGLTRGLGAEGPISQLYQKNKTDFFPHDGPLSEVVERLAGIPLAFQPGKGWSPGVSADVLGRVVEVVSGRTLGEFFQERILGPLVMTDTGFAIPGSQKNRFAPSSPGAGDDGPNREEASDIAPMTGEVVTLSGGRGLVSTLPDYFRFTELFRLKGEVDGARLLGRKTVDYMTRDHLINTLSGADRPAAPHIPPAGLGFGLGFFVMIDPARARVMGSPG